MTDALVNAKSDKGMIRVLRIYHSGRDRGHRRRERALVEAGVDLSLVVPQDWPDPGSEQKLSAEPFSVHELPVLRAGDVNRHRYADMQALTNLVHDLDPQVIDIHEEPFSLAARQWLTVVGDRPVVMYTAQNLDKRFPPPFSRYEAHALARVQGIYPCSRQAASVARGKGFRGVVEVMPLGYDPTLLHPGEQAHDDDPFTLALVGRMVASKGVLDAVRALAAVRVRRPARLMLLGSGPEIEPALSLAESLGVREHVEVRSWLGVEELAQCYRKMHVLLIPSTATTTWVEQFGRVIVEAQACGVPVVGYASGSIPEVMGDGGLAVPEGDLPGLIEACTVLAEDADRWHSFRETGLERTRLATWSAVARRQVGLYRTVLGMPTRLYDKPVVTGGVETRSRARDEFGSPATTSTSERPVALPVIRESRHLDRAVGTVIDQVSGWWKDHHRMIRD